MTETTVQFKPREQWRAGMTPEKLVEELDRTLKLPGLANVWIAPIRNRIDMLVGLQANDGSFAIRQTS